MFSIEDILRRASSTGTRTNRCGATIATLESVAYTKPLPGAKSCAPRPPASPLVDPPPGATSLVDPFDDASTSAPSTYRYPLVTSLRGYSAPMDEDNRRWSIADLLEASNLTSSSPPTKADAPSTSASTSTRRANASSTSASMREADAPSTNASTSIRRANASSTSASMREADVSPISASTSMRDADAPPTSASMPVKRRRRAKK